MNQLATISSQNRVPPGVWVGIMAKKKPVQAQKEPVLSKVEEARALLQKEEKKLSPLEEGYQAQRKVVREAQDKVTEAEKEARNVRRGLLMTALIQNPDLLDVLAPEHFFEKPGCDISSDPERCARCFLEALRKDDWLDPDIRFEFFVSVPD